MIGQIVESEVDQGETCNGQDSRWDSYASLYGTEECGPGKSQGFDSGEEWSDYPEVAV